MLATRPPKRRAREKAERDRAEAALIENLLEQAGRPRITPSNAAEYPPPNPYERRCQGDSCACKRPKGLSLLAPKRVIRKKNPFTCRGGRKDRWCFQSPCSGPLVHETSELELWYAQLTGRQWMGRFPYGIEICFEQAFSLWRRRTMHRPERERKRTSKGKAPLMASLQYVKSDGETESGGETESVDSGEDNGGYGEF